MTNISTIMGYTRKEWNLIYKLYLLTKKEEPRNPLKLIEFWEDQGKGGPQSILDLAARIIESMCIDSDYNEQLSEFMKKLLMENKDD